MLEAVIFVMYVLPQQKKHIKTTVYILRLSIFFILNIMIFPDKLVRIFQSNKIQNLLQCWNKNPSILKGKDEKYI